MLGVDMMVGHWEFTYGKEQVLKLTGDKDNKGMLNAEFISQNISDEEWNELIYKPYSIRNMNGVKIGFLGQSFPYTKTANPVNVNGWSYGLRLEDMQKYVNELRGKCDLVVLLSHDGFNVDQEVAKRVKILPIFTLLLLCQSIFAQEYTLKDLKVNGKVKKITRFLYGSNEASDQMDSLYLYNQNIQFFNELGYLTLDSGAQLS